MSKTDQTNKKRQLSYSSNIDFFLLQHDDEIQTFQRRQSHLFIPASQVSALSGFNPYSNLPEIFLSLVYQGSIGSLLKYRDAQLLGLTLTSTTELLSDIANRGGDEIQNILKMSEDIKKGRRKVENIDTVKKLKENVVKAATASKTLTKSDIQQLVDGVTHNLHTGFGHLHEANALDEYEKLCGCTIRERNAETKCWDFIRLKEPSSPVSKDASSSMHLVIPKGDSYTLESSYRTWMNIPTCGSSSEHAIEINDEDDENNFNSLQDEPIFSIMGCIDGLRDEPFILTKKLPSDSSHHCDGNRSETQEDDTDVWSLRTLVVEMKHRMSRFFLPPPLYDQIQCVVYCLMFNTEVGEIVQVIRNKINKDQPTAEEMAELPWIDWGASSAAKKVAKPLDIRISRIALDDPTSRHRQNFFGVIVPRLGIIADAVYSFRRDDTKRYAMLSALASASQSDNDDEIWNLLFQECPFLMDCDTAFHKKKKDVK